MRKIFKGILSLGLAIAVCAGATAFYGAAEYTVADAATTTAATYYNSITAQSGTALLGQLHDLITSSRTKYSSYDECHTQGTKTDPGSASNTVMEYYTHIDIPYSSWDVSGGWNREHVWPKADSNGLWKSSTVGGGADLHHIRPAEKDLNNHRGNLKYGEVSNGTAQYTSVSHVLGGYSNSSTFEPLDNVKGDTARILMYVYTHYNTYSNAIFGGNAKTNGSGSSSYFGTLNFTHIITASNEAAAKKLLLEWNELDPVDEIERHRNDAVYAIQGNRNPFIDNESYAEAIWGDGTVIDPPPSVTLQSLSLNSTSLKLNVGGTYDLTVTPNPSNASASVNWTSSDSAVATVSNGRVTAKAAGTATITATSTTNSSIKATATVTVSGSSTSETTGKATVTRDSFTNASDSYAFYNWESGGIEGIAYIYGAEAGNMQFNKKQSSYYLASTTATAAPIKSVTVKSVDGKSDRPWRLLTSTTAYGEVSGKPENGTDRGTKTVTSEGVTWTIDGNDTYFALTYELEGTSGAAYLDSIEVEYGSSGASGTTEDLREIILSPAEFTLAEGAGAKLTVVGVPATANAEVTWTSSDSSIATVSADGTVTAVKTGTAIITATSKNNSAIKATAIVTVTAKAQAVIGEKAAAFREAVAAIDNESTLSARHTAINTAVRAYNMLFLIDKADCAAEIETLRAAIASYNEAVKAYNRAADAAEESALKGAGKLV